MAGGEQRLQLFILDKAVGLVVALALLVLHHVALFVQLRLVQRRKQIDHPVGLHPQRHIDGGGRNGLEIVRAVEPGRAVHAGRADILERAEIVLIIVFRPVEHDVFEQVREAGLPVRLVAGTDVIPDADSYDRRFVVFVDHHGQAVIQGEFLERDIHVRNFDIGFRRLVAAPGALFGLVGRGGVVFGLRGVVVGCIGGEILVVASRGQQQNASRDSGKTDRFEHDQGTPS